MPRFHRITELPDGPALTLFVGVGRRSSWGFYDTAAGALIPHGERGRRGQ